mmetsp:Transcript_13605/g.24145  ORF Transcript_13605/g.24145 Transcript_13605/m.24145 type:complete len:198 (-) Transcript_13605:745-1338(-)
MLCTVTENVCLVAGRENAVRQQFRRRSTRPASCWPLRRLFRVGTTLASSASGVQQFPADDDVSKRRLQQPGGAERCQLRFVVGIEVEEPGSGVREALRCHSGASLLRDVMQENLVAVDLYRHWGKVWQCGGSGKCGACMVKVTNGQELLSEHTQVERDVLEGKGCGNCRLACQAWVGNGRNSGHIHLSLDTPPNPSM